MIDARRLLDDLQPLRRHLEDDLRERSEQVPELGQRLRDEWQAARQRERTAQTYEAWRDDTLAQAAVMWLLACVFVRFLEDNALVDMPRLSGPNEKLQLARDQRTLYFQAHPHASDRDYLYDVFGALAALPAAAPLFDRRHNPIWETGISGDAATLVIDFWQRIDAGTGALVHDFTDSEWQTRFLGDLYQDLSESARKKYALLQTPDFVLQFILDRTLTPAIQEFGFREVRLIDPACGSGHFLLAAFERLVRLYAQQEPGGNPREQSQRALAQVSGVDLNPFAVAIARFRLLLAALRASTVTRLVDAPAFTMELAAGDSLLHGPRPGDQGLRQTYLDPEADPLAHVYATEDADDLKLIMGRRYHVVVGNPPYITPKDAALNQAYRSRFGSCHMKYSLGVPFTERLFDLALEPASGDSAPAGYVGMITANSFMKREFGKKLIEEYVPRWDLTHVIDTSGAYIPGHGTPTVILFGRHRKPTSLTVRAVLGIKGEPTTPDDPAQGLVWRAIVDQSDRPGSSSDFVSVSEASREKFHRHPWGLGGGGAAELKEAIEAAASKSLGTLCDSIGFGAILGEDDAFGRAVGAPALASLPSELKRPLVEGDLVRDWSLRSRTEVLFPYSPSIELVNEDVVSERLWPLRTVLRNRADFSKKTYAEAGRPYWEYHQIPVDKNRTALAIAFAFVATHNHFVLDRGGKVFNRSAPIIKLPPGGTEDDHLGLVGILNSSTACFWMKQTFHNKGSTVDERGARQRTMPFEDFFEFTGTGLQSFPVPQESCLQVARERDALGSTLAEKVPRTAKAFEVHALLSQQWTATVERMIGLQEEIDWKCYGLYGLTDSAPVTSGAVPRVALGQRAFEIAMARRMASGELKSAWFERHGSTPTTDIPSDWPESYRQVVNQRVKVIESSAEIALVEQPEYKRRWNVEPWPEQLERAQRAWLLDRLESSRYWADIAPTSVARLADVARQDDEFMRVAALYRGQDSFDVSALIAELVESAAVPFLPVLRYRPSGLRKRELWERTWELQRAEDAVDARVGFPEGDPLRLTVDEAAAKKQEEIGDIPVPPKYISADFANGVFWQLRGKLDVPKERFITYPHCERDADRTAVIAWAAWDHLQQAKALATYYVQMNESEGWNRERLTPLLAGLLELLPWILQWHNDVDPEYGQRMGEYYAGFVDEEARALGLMRETIRAWTPPAAASRRRARSSKRTPQTDE
jgi:hypothetical protein